MKKFVNRTEELRFLESEYKREEASLVVIYGRRRVGKTSLIKEFIKDKKALYFLATEESIDMNLDFFKNLAAEHMNNALLKEAKLDRWEPVFDALVQEGERQVIIIDEFQYLGKSDASFPSVFQRIWDQQLKDKSIMVILCGSLISMMVDQTLSYSSPLYGRRTGQIRLKQIPFSYYHAFFMDKPLNELIEFYSVTGGVPKYIEMVKDCHTIWEAIMERVMSSSSLLYEEPFYLLEREVAEIGSYFSVLRAIAAGHHKLGNMATFLEVKQTSLTRYLKVLMDLDILEREVPVTEKNPEKSKKGLYRFKDNYLKFWFRFIYPNRSRIEENMNAALGRKILENFIDGHVAYVYEDIAKENLKGLLPSTNHNISIRAIGRWWDKNQEIDIVGVDEESNTIVFGECKYSENKVGISVLRNLQTKSRHVVWGGPGRVELFALYSINGFTDDLYQYAKERKELILVHGLMEVR